MCSNFSIAHGRCSVNTDGTELFVEQTRNHKKKVDNTRRHYKSFIWGAYKLEDMGQMMPTTEQSHAYFCLHTTLWSLKSNMFAIWSFTLWPFTVKYLLSGSLQGQLLSYMLTYIMKWTEYTWSSISEPSQHHRFQPGLYYKTQVPLGNGHSNGIMLPNMNG